MTNGFVAGTLIHTLDGPKPVEDIRVGDSLLSYPEDKPVPEVYREAPESKYIYAKVTGISVHKDQAIASVTVWDLGNNIKETIALALNQPIYVEGGGWTLAAQLKWGNALLNRDFANLLMKKCQPATDVASLFNIELAEFNTCFVGKLAAWVRTGDPE